MPVSRSAYSSRPIGEPRAPVGGSHSNHSKAIKLYQRNTTRDAWEDGDQAPGEEPDEAGRDPEAAEAAGA